MSLFGSKIADSFVLSCLAMIAIPVRELRWNSILFSCVDSKLTTGILLLYTSRRKMRNDDVHSKGRIKTSNICISDLFVILHSQLLMACIPLLQLETYKRWFNSLKWSSHPRWLNETFKRWCGESKAKSTVRTQLFMILPKGVESR